MEQKHKSEMAKWALFSFLVVISVFSVRYAVGQSSQPDPTKHLERTLDGITYTLDRDSSSNNSFKVSLGIQNSSNNPRLFNIKVCLVKSIFKGSPLSRVASPSDVEKYVLDSRSSRKVLRPGASWQLKETLDMPRNNTGNSDRATYSIELLSNGQVVSGIPIQLGQPLSTN